MVFSWHENTPRVFRVFVFTLSTLGVAYQHRYQQVVFENQAVKLLQPMQRLNIIWIIIIEIILTAYAELPTPLRTPQTSGHSSFRISDLLLWSLKLPPSHGSKIIIFYLSQSKCTVSALFLHGFKGCNGHSDLQNTTKGAEIIQWKITMLCTKIT